MAQFLPDDIDFRAYERQTDAKAKVRKASAFGRELRAEFAQRERSDRPTCMESTKLGRELEFRPGEVTVWAGYSGHKKSFFTGQVMLDLCRLDKRVLMASLEMQPARSLARMARNVSASVRPSPRELDDFDAWTDNRLWVFDHVGRIAPAMCLAVMRYFADELQGEHVVIDSMMMVCASEESLDEQKQFVTDLVRVAQETGLHIHLVAHCKKPQDDTKPPTKYDVRGSTAITDQAHNVVMVWANKAKQEKLRRKTADVTVGDEPDALVIVDKQRNGEFEGRLMLWFDATSLRFVDDRHSPVYPRNLNPDSRY